MDKKTIIYVGNFDFPFGNASGKRVYGNGKALESAGYKTVFVGMSRNLDSNGNLEDTKQVYDGFEYYNFPYPRGSKDWVNYRSIQKQFIEWMEKRKDTTFAIICYGSPRLSMFISGVSRWGKKNGIKVISDCVDWLEAKTGNLVFDIAKTVDTYYQKAIANKQVDGVICISSYLQKYYAKAGKKTVIVPPLSTYVSDETAINANEIPQFVYAGNSFRNKVEIKDLSTLKDRVDKMIDILKALKENGIRFKFYYFGLDKENYLMAFPMQKDTIEYLGDYIEFCGFQDNAVVTERIKNADFTFLVRDVKKSTMAGFPTKVSESISYGTPVITTRTSDIELYLEDEKNVVFVDQDDLVKSAEIIGNIISSNRYVALKENCSKNTIFYYETFAKGIQEFLEKL